MKITLLYFFFIFFPALAQKLLLKQNNTITKKNNSATYSIDISEYESYEFMVTLTQSYESSQLILLLSQKEEDFMKGDQFIEDLRYRRQTFIQIRIEAQYDYWSFLQGHQVQRILITQRNFHNLYRQKYNVFDAPSSLLEFKILPISILTGQNLTYEITIEDIRDQKYISKNFCSHNGAFNPDSLICQCEVQYFDSQCLTALQPIEDIKGQNQTCINPINTVSANTGKFFSLKVSSLKDGIVVSPIIKTYSGKLHYTYGCLDTIKQYPSQYVYEKPMTLLNKTLGIIQGEIDSCYNNSLTLDSQMKTDNLPRFIILLQNPDLAEVIFAFSYNSRDNSNIAVLLQALIVTVLIFFVLTLFVAIIIWLRKKQVQNVRLVNFRAGPETPTQQIVSQFQKTSSSSASTGMHLVQRVYQRLKQEFPAFDEFNECLICLVEFNGKDLVKVTPCLHVFHSSCINMWVARQSICPLCRASLKVTKETEICVTDTARNNLMSYMQTNGQDEQIISPRNDAQGTKNKFFSRLLNRVNVDNETILSQQKRKRVAFRPHIPHRKKSSQKSDHDNAFQQQTKKSLEPESIQRDKNIEILLDVQSGRHSLNSPTEEKQD